MRHQAQLLRSGITSELGMFSFPSQGGETLRAEPIVYVQNVIEKVTSILDEHERYIAYTHELVLHLNVESGRKKEKEGEGGRERHMTKREGERGRGRVGGRRKKEDEA